MQSTRILWLRRMWTSNYSKISVNKAGRQRVANNAYRGVASAADAAIMQGLVESILLPTNNDVSN